MGAKISNYCADHDPEQKQYHQTQQQQAKALLN